MPGTAVQAAPVLSTWEDESGFDDLDLDQLVSQHNRSKATPLSSSSHGHSSTGGGSQSVTRPATAAASAHVRSAAQAHLVTAPQASLPLQHTSTAVPRQQNTVAGSTAQQQSATGFSTGQHIAAGQSSQRQATLPVQPANAAQPVPKYPAEDLGLQGVNERLVDLSNLIIDAMCEPQQMAVLHKERKHLLQVQQRLKSAGAMPLTQPAAHTALADMQQNKHLQAADNDSRHSNWPQPSSANMHGGFDSQQSGVPRQMPNAAFGQSNGWDQGAVSASLPGNPWEGDHQSRQHSMQHAGSSSYAYDAPAAGFRSDLYGP